ncbi:esterase E4-like [Apis florea]|uniref:esterase E4-like n=1 Tax=Apis florea TaxID=7463 RepID=UPI0006299B71|nr:esterase E4-like [Apis florea]
MRISCVIAFYIISIGNVLYCSISAYPEATPPIGKIRGSILTSRLGKKIYSFRGVRYAEPPTERRRFQIATPLADWNDVYDASNEGPGCPNLDRTNFKFEDCLRLNVYTGKLPSKDENVTRPVLVFFHPGGFYFFSGQSYLFGPQYLLDHDIVLVTVNFRLGSLGFISTGDSHAPGNLGLKDQVLALRWVRRNIAAFGGNPNSVTISGCSVGGLSVWLHMVSPMSKNLFHRAIVMSGSLLNAEPFPTQQIDLARKQAKLLNCPSDNSEDMLTCLRSRPVANFTDTMSEFFEWNKDPILIWKPVVEPNIPGVERFLPAQPVELIRRGKFHKVPAIFGITRDEFGGVVVAFENNTRAGNDMYRDMNENWYRIAPISFMYERNTSRSQRISEELRKFYFEEEAIDSARRDGLARIYEDSIIKFPQYRGAKLIAENSPAPVYFYMFTYQGRFSFSMWNSTTPYGIEHQDDLQYLFYMEKIFPYFHEFTPEKRMVELYTSMWASFMENGEPVPNNNEAFKGVTWDRFVQNNYLEINLNSSMKTGLYSDRMKKWENLFPLSLMSEVSRK